MMLITLVASSALGLGAAATDEISISPAPEPVPALRYQFQPNAVNMRGGDAVQMYMQAALLLSRLAPEETERVAALLELPFEQLADAEGLSDLETRYQDVGQLLHLAARTDHCAWDIPIRELGIATLLPELGSLRQAARILGAHARVAMSEGDFETAFQDIRSGMALGRNVGQGPTLIHGLVGIAVQALMLERVEELASLEGAPNLYWALASEPGISLQNALRYEASFIDFANVGIRELDHTTMSIPELEYRTRAAIENFTRMMGGVEFANLDGGSGSIQSSTFFGIAQVMTVYPKAKQAFMDNGMNEADVDALPVTYVTLRYFYDDYARMRDDIFKWFTLPYWDARPGIVEAETALEAVADRRMNPFIMVLPALSKARESRTRIEREIDVRMLVESLRQHAALHGRFPASLDELTLPAPMDPVTGGPFSYARTSDGARIKAPPIVPSRSQDAIDLHLTIGGSR